MPRSTKANLPWIDAVGSKVTAQLSKRHNRPIIYRQSGPYNQRKTPHVGVYFNDPILHHIAPVSQSDSVDFRFGFYLERSFATNIYVGFDLLNPTLCKRCFMPNIRVDQAVTADKLTAWLHHYSVNDAYVGMGQDGGGRSVTYSDDGYDVLSRALGNYASSGRKVESFSWGRCHFSAIAQLPAFQGWGEANLVDEASQLAEAMLISFEKLDFLYLMLFPRDLGPSRMSGGQNRALKSKQPNCRCSWASEEHCVGLVNAAHIVPDRLGGHAVPSNLFWLCGFHHNLLDIYLKATMSIDRSSKQIIASVSLTPPLQNKAGGIPLAFWESIQNKRVWALPLKSDSISHLFG